MASWLEEHLEEFVKPHLGKIPDITSSERAAWEPNAEGYMIVWDALKKIHKGIPLIFPGRDTYLVEIFARLENYPTTFRPDISSVVAGHPSLKGIYVDYYGFDSGYSGSVLKAMGVKEWSLVSGQHQLPCNKPGLCSLMEGAPKYWKRGDTDRNGSIKQLFSEESEFSRACQLTRIFAEKASGKLKIYAPTKVSVEGRII